MKSYVIVTKADSNFYEGLIALIKSVQHVLGKQRIVVIDCGLSKKEKDYCLTLGVEFFQGCVSRFDVPYDYYTQAIYGFFSIDYSLFNEDVILHLDADVIVIDKIDKLIEYGFKYGCAAIEDYPKLDFSFQVQNIETMEKVKKIIPNLKVNHVTFNGGIFSINRKYYIDKVLPYIKQLLPLHKDLYGNDQAIMNLAMYAANPLFAYKNIGHAYNARPFYSRDEKVPKMKIIEQNSNYFKVLGIVDNIKIIHYVGKVKPWMNDYDKSCDSFKVWSYYAENNYEKK